VKIRRLIPVIALSVLFLFAWVVLPVQASEAIQTHLSDRASAIWSKDRPTPILPLEEEPPVLGEPCGHGELMPPTVICLYGSVYSLPAGGGSIPVASAHITVSLGTQALTITTQVPPGEADPAYGIDISSLEPGFLQPLTITATYDGMQVTRQVIVFPNFNTMSQRFDLYISEVGGFADEAVMGSVVDFGERSAVVGADVRLEYAGQFISTVTISNPLEPLPIYTFSWADVAMLGAGEGSMVTLVAEYNGDISARQVVLGAPDGDPLQVSFSTSWKCDDFDPIPRTSGGEGFPRTSGGEGFPDVACIWGYIVLNGEPITDATAHFEVNGKTHEVTTYVFPGEQMPRYGLGIWGASEWDGITAIATALYPGVKSQANTITISLDEQQSQRVDLALYQTSVLQNLSSGNHVNSLLHYNDVVLAGTNGGVFFWDEDGGSYSNLSTLDGLANNEVQSIATDSAGNQWYVYPHGVSMFNPGSQEWTTWRSTDIDLAPSCGFIQVATNLSNGEVWVATTCKALKYIPETKSWEEYDGTDGLPSNQIYYIYLEDPGFVWFGTYTSGIARLNLDTNVWSYWSEDQGLPAASVGFIFRDHQDNTWSCAQQILHKYNPLLDIWEATSVRCEHDSYVIDKTGTLWIGSNIGVTKLDPITGITETLTVADGLLDNRVYAMAMDQDDRFWFGTYSKGINIYNSTNGAWQYLITQDNQPGSFYAWFLSIDNDGVVWTPNHHETQSPNGLLRHDPAAGTWQILTTADGLAGNGISAILQDRLGNLLVFDRLSGQSQTYSFYNITNRIWEIKSATGLFTYGVDDAFLELNGDIWVAHGGGYVSHYADATDTWSVLPTTPDMGNSSTVNDIIVDLEGRVYIAPASGRPVQRYNASTETWESIGVPANTMAIDGGGQLWIGVNNVYIYRFDPASGTLQNFKVPKEGNFQVEGILVDRHNDIWCALYDASDYDGGIARYTPSENHWQFYTMNDGLISNRNMALAEAPNGNIWVASMYGISELQVASLESDLALRGTALSVVDPTLPITYIFEISDQGEIDARDVTFTFSLPAYASLITATIPTTPTFPLVGNLGTIQAGQTITFTVVISLPDELEPGTIYTPTMEVATSSPESFLANNIYTIRTLVIDPNMADVRVSISGPPLLLPGGLASYIILIDDIGGLDAENCTVTTPLDPQMTFHSAWPAPISLFPPSWDLGTLVSQASPYYIVLTTTVSPDILPGADLSISALATTTTPENNLSNNIASISVPTALENALTLVLAAPDRMAEQYGAADILTRLYAWADHPSVQGVILNVESDPVVQAAYAAWDVNPGSWQAANDVAEAIKVLVDQFTDTYPNLAYLVIVGDDEIIPFYRVADQNPTFWHEFHYRQSVPAGTLRDAFAADRILTDDFYADRSPTVPGSPFWVDGHELFLPDFAIGRLVGEPEEMSAILEAFLTNDGVITLDPGLIGGDPSLTRDLREAQCLAYQNDGLSASCPGSSSQFRQDFLDMLLGSFWAAFHSNHFFLGAIPSYEIAERPEPYNDSLLATIGCHAGLPELSLSGWPSLAQAFLGQGGTFIGSTSYAYGSRLSIAYSEDLALELTNRLLAGESQEIGLALVQAKQAYYAKHAWFDYLDEKVLIPITLYGLPMLRVSSPATAGQGVPDLPGTTSMASWDNSSVVTITLSDMTFNYTTTVDGIFYDYNGQILAQEGLPVQPLLNLPVEAKLNNQTLRDVRLVSASHEQFWGFDPVVNQNWALSVYLPSEIVEPLLTLIGWDRDLPYSLGRFFGLDDAKAVLNLVLGAYHAETQRELLFHDLTLELTYSDSADWEKPRLSYVTRSQDAGSTSFQVGAVDNIGVALVQVVYDDGVGSWRSINLALAGNQWSGQTLDSVDRFYIQVTDVSGNVFTSIWNPPNLILLPLVTR